MSPSNSPTPDRVAQATTLLSTGRPADAVALLGPQNGPRTAAESTVYAEALHLTGRADDAVLAARGAAAEAAAARDGVTMRTAAAVLAIAFARKSGRAEAAEARAALVPVLPRGGAKIAWEDARVLHADGVLRLREGDLAGARVSLLQALAGMRGAGDRWRAATILDSLGIVHLRNGDAYRAQQAFRESLAAKESCGDLAGEAITCGNLGRLLLQEGDAAEALTFFDANLARTLVVADLHGEVVAMNGRGMALLELGRFADADRVLREALALAQSRAMTKQVGLCLKDLAIVAERQGRYDDALDLVRSAKAQFASQDNQEAVGFCTLVEGRIFLRADQMDAARNALARAVRALREVRRPELLAEALLRLAEASLTSHADGAARWIDEAEALAREHLLRGIVEDARALRARSTPAEAGRSITLRSALGLGGGAREFVLLDVLGRGAQGEAWRALDVRTGALAVLKRVSPKGGFVGKVSAVQRLQSEFEAAMRVDHPAVVRVLGFERAGDEFYLAMEMLAGPDLRTRIDQGAPPSETACTWVRRIAEGLGALHAEQVIHRDLKPENVVFGGPDLPVLIDFGLALLDTPQGGAASEVAGTLCYMAPEQILGQALDHRADLFALGLVAAELVTGRNPIAAACAPEGVSYNRVATLLVQAPAVRRMASSIRWGDDVSDAFRSAVLRLLSHAPTDRFSTAEEFVTAAFAE